MWMQRQVYLLVTPTARIICLLARETKAKTVLLSVKSQSDMLFTPAALPALSCL